MKTHSSFVLRPSYFVLPLALAMVTLTARAESVTIASAADWATFASRVNSGESNLDAMMTNDVWLDNSAPYVGNDGSHLWSGTFDGAGHTLKLDWTRTEDYVAPFRFTSGCSISNLHVTGTIKTSGIRAAGFIARPQPGNTTLRCCRSSVTIDSSFEGEARHGGFIGYTYWSSFHIYFYDCLFDGSLLGPDTTGCCGFVGFNSNDPYVIFDKCLFAPRQVTLSSSGASTFVHSYLSAHASFSHSYYFQAFGMAQGSDASSMSADDLVAALGSNWTNVDGQVCLALFRDPAPAVIGFTYQGALRDAQGNALGAGTRTVAFRLYTQAAGGTPIWGRSHEVLLDGNGLFNVALSDETGDAIEGVVSNGLHAALAANAGTSLYLGLTVADASAEISPRQKILAVPFAMYALDASAAKGNLAVADSVTAAEANVRGASSASSAAIGEKASAGSLAVASTLSIGGNLEIEGAFSGYGSFPIGAIVIWSGSVDNIPDGWALCNGLTVNGLPTPDLRGRFVPGAGNTYAVGAMGGEEKHKLTVREMPSHNHTYSFTGADLDLSWSGNNNFYNQSQKYPDKTNTKSTNYTGGDQPHENRPPFYALCYIMRVR